MIRAVESLVGFSGPQFAGGLAARYVTAIALTWPATIRHC